MRATPSNILLRKPETLYVVENLFHDALLTYSTENGQVFTIFLPNIQHLKKMSDPLNRFQ